MIMATAHRNREIDDALRELADNVGALVEFEPNTKGGHRRVYFTLNGQTRFDVLSTTPAHGGVVHAALRQAKRTLRSLGASL
jgi:hypothetical protein